MYKRQGYSRFPVRSGADADELIGYIHLADVLETDPIRRDHIIERRWIRPLEAVPTTTSLQATLETLRRSSSHLARVVDEDGSTRGVITLEDILEELVGEVADATQRRPQA